MAALMETEMMAGNEPVPLSDERAVLDLLGKSVLNLWDTVNTLTRLRPTKRDRFRVSIFGSARIAPDHWVYAAVRDTAAELTRLGCDIVTGGGAALWTGHAASTAADNVATRQPDRAALAASPLDSLDPASIPSASRFKGMPVELVAIPIFALPEDHRLNRKVLALVFDETGRRLAIVTAEDQPGACENPWDQRQLFLPERGVRT